MRNDWSERTMYLAQIFAKAIKVSPNDAVITSRELTRMCGSRETFEEIMIGMENPNSELARLLTIMGNAFHRGNDEAPEEVDTVDLASMAKQIRVHSRL